MGKNKNKNKNKSAAAGNSAEQYQSAFEEALREKK